jgi:hypothetical protein
MTIPLPRTATVLALCSLVLTGAAGAQPAPPPLPDLAPPPAGAARETDLSPQVTILQRGDERVEEFRLRGQLYMIKVTPTHGVPYYLIDERGDGRLIRRDSLDERLLVPTWVLFRF